MKRSVLFEQTLFVVLPSIKTDAGQKKLLLLARWAPLFVQASVRIAVLCPDSDLILAQESLFLHLPFLMISDPDQTCADLLGCMQTRIVFGKEQRVCVCSLILCSDPDGFPDLILRHVLPESLYKVFAKAQKNRQKSLNARARALVDNPYRYC